MNIVKIQFRGLNSVKTFVNILQHYDNEFDIIDQRYVIDAKSIMGLFSIDLTHPVDLKIYCEDDETMNKILGDLNDYNYLVK